MRLIKDKRRLNVIFFIAGIFNLFIASFLVLGNVNYFQSGLSRTLVFFYKIFMNVYFISCVFIYAIILSKMDNSYSTSLRLAYLVIGGLIIILNLLLALILALLNGEGFTFINPLH